MGTWLTRFAAIFPCAAVGPWTTLATHALTDTSYAPDFTARVECVSRILIVTRADVNSVLGINTSPTTPRHADYANGAEWSLAGAGPSPTLTGRSGRVLSDGALADLMPSDGAADLGFVLTQQPASLVPSGADLWAEGARDAASHEAAPAASAMGMVGGEVRGGRARDRERASN